MTGNRGNSLPEFASLDALVEFFDTHDLGDYWNQMPEVDFEVDIKRRTRLFALDDRLAGKLTEIARSRNIPSTTLIHSWLGEKIQSQA